MQNSCQHFHIENLERHQHLSTKNTFQPFLIPALHKTSLISTPNAATIAGTSEPIEIGRSPCPQFAALIRRPFTA
jgi:hypothetical protein